MTDKEKIDFVADWRWAEEVEHWIKKIDFDWMENFKTKRNQGNFLVQRDCKMVHMDCS